MGEKPEPTPLPSPVPFPDDSAPLYTVGQVADMLGLQAAFLRRLDAYNIVSPSRSAGGQRRYSRIEINDIHAITELVGEGLTLAGAQRILELQAENAQLRRRLDELNAGGNARGALE
jgi:MerR family transcriptional regulator, heat shock protein HspR